MDFKNLLESSKAILLDGAMGTELDRRGLADKARSNLLAPETVLDIHREYFSCGSQVAITNTLTMNRLFIETHGLDLEVNAANRAGARLARIAAGERGYVLGNLSSTGQMLEPYGTYSEARFQSAFQEQAAALLEEGVDGFIIETVFDLREALCALRACKRLSSLPVIVSMAFHTELNGGRTIMGNSAQECASILSQEGADAIGANCGDLDPAQMAVVVAALSASTTLPISAEPNAGRPELRNGETVFSMEPEAFSHGVWECHKAGARLLGGCCGTGPAHIKALAELFSR